MTLTRLPMTEDQLLTAIVEAAHYYGWLVYHVRNSKAGITQGDPGFPDLVIGKNGRKPLILELKGDGGRVSSAQADWLDALTSVGAEAIWPRDLDYVLERLR